MNNQNNDSVQLKVVFLAAIAALAYAVVAGLWLVLWHNYRTLLPVMTRLGEPRDPLWFGDWIFVAVTSLLIFLLLRNFLPAAPLTLFRIPRVAADDAPPFPVGRVIFMGFGVLAVAISTAALIDYLSVRERIAESVNSEVESVVELKRGQLARWVAEHGHDLEAVTENPYVTRDLRAWLQRAEKGEKPPERVLERFFILKRLQGYQRLTLLDAEGKLLPQISLDEEPLADVDRQIRGLVMLAGSVGIPVLRVLGSATGEQRVAIAAPFFSQTRAGKQVFAYLYAELAPALRLLPILDSWPVPSKTAQTLLVQTDANSLEGRAYVKGVPGGLSLATRKIAGLDAMVLDLAKGERFKRGEALDDEGHRLTVSAERVPGTSWIVVGSEQFEERLAPINRLAVWSGLVVAAVLTVCALLSLLVAHYQQALHVISRKRAHEDHAALVAHYDYLAKYANDLIVFADRVGQIIEVNDRALADSGYTREELLAMNLRDLVPEHELRAFEAVLRTLGEEGALFETAYRKKDGAVVPVEVSGREIHVEGKMYLQGVVRDISERKREEARVSALLSLSKLAPTVDEASLLQEGLKVVEKLTRSCTGFIFRVNADRTRMERVAWITDSSASYCQRIVQSDDRPPVLEAALWDDGCRLADPLLLDADDPATDWSGLPEGYANLQRLISVPLLEGGGVQMVLGVGNSEIPYRTYDIDTVNLFGAELMDIVQRKRAEDAMRSAEEQFRGLVEQSFAGIFIVIERKFYYVNPRLAEICGYASAVEMQGVDFLEIIATTARDRELQSFRQLWTGLVQSVDRTFPLLRRDGETIEAGLHAARASYQGRPAVVGMLQDISEKMRAEAQISSYIDRMETAFMSTVKVAMTLGEMRDPYTAGHQRRVAELAVVLGAELGFDARRQEGLRVAGYLHDIGKISIPAEILVKPGRLTPVEFDLIKGHPQLGYEVLKDVEFPWPVAEVAHQHHERNDGSGYPQGLKGDEILLEARIMAVADVVEAMSSHRPYRAGLGIDAALAEIRRGRGSAFDPEVADACLRLFEEKGYQIPV